MNSGDLFERAVAAHGAGKLAEAARLYRAVLAGAPDHAGALHLLGVIAFQHGRLDEAERLIDRALAADPALANAWSNRGLVLQRQGRAAEAVASFERALALRPDFAEAEFNRGVALAALGRAAEALESYDHALALRPDYVEALSNRGAALKALGRPAEALICCNQALALRPGHPAILTNRGNVLNDLGRPAEALLCFERALAVRPDHEEAQLGRGNALMAERRPADALAAYDRALAIRADYAEALVNRGNALAALLRPAEALAAYDRALALRPDDVAALAHRGTLLLGGRDYAGAAADFDRVLVLAPDHPYARGHALHAKMHLCDWTGFDDAVACIAAEVRAGRRASVPFAFLAMSDSAPDQLACARTYVADTCPASPTPLWRGERYGHHRVRVAYLSADFYAHATAYLMAGLFERHDRSRFEIVGVSFGPDAKSETRTRLVRAFDRFIDVRGQGDERVARLLRELEIDIAVDLKGFTTDYRAEIFALRPAPVQVSYLGYPGTMGADYIDYILADRIVIPDGDRRHYSERVVYLPDSYQANDDARRIADRAPTRAEAGLPENGFVFCSFNNSFKIAPAMFGIWMRLLRAVDGSVLWLLRTSDDAMRNLRREAETRGVAGERLVFAPFAALDDHLARHLLADLFLDTLPYNAHTTASDALWAGLPVVTCLGTTFAGRVAASLLHAVGLPELVAPSLADYEALALRLARDRDALAAIRAKLARNRDAYPLFDTDRFRRHIEAAYETIWRRAEAGLPPEPFAVEDVS